MDRWQRVHKPPSRQPYDYPSFSSTLLDSIYRSIDDDESNRGAPDPYLQIKKKQAPEWAPPPLTRVKPPRPRHFHSTTSSSSDCSSYGGFSSSDPDSAPLRLKPIRTGSRSNPPPPIAIPIPIPPEKKKKNKNLNSIRSKFRDPTSPAAKLASFLNSLFTSTPRNGRKQRAASAAAAARAAEESACSTASSYSRSCLVKTPSTADNGIKRSVRFSLPVDGGKKKMMTKWRNFEAEDDDVASDSSSDLFELENLTPIGRYRDELPVYETTHLGGLIL